MATRTADDDAREPAGEAEPAATVGHDPANSNRAGAALPALKAKTMSWSERLDDGVVLRWAFRTILAGTIIVLALDFRSLQGMASDIPAAPATEHMVLPPALSDGEPPAPPHEIEASPETLRQPAAITLAANGVLRLEGAIEPGAASRFEEEIDARGEYIRTVELNSPGGSVDDAIRIGAMIRERGFDTQVMDGALCASSCPLVLAGGVERRAGEEAVIGVHQVYGAVDAQVSSPEAMSRAQNVTARVTRHLTDMGVDPALWLHALDTPPDRLYYLDTEEMTEFRLAGGSDEAEALNAAASAL